MQNLKIEYIDIDKIQPNEYNPKSISKKQYDQLKKSIEKFGVIDPLILNSAENRKNKLIGGHQRLKILKELNYKNVPVIFVNIQDIEKEKELCLRLSKNTGEFDAFLISNFDSDFLKNIGFDEDELKSFSIKETIENIQEKEIKSYQYVHILLTVEKENSFDLLEKIEKLKKELKYQIEVETNATKNK